MKQRLFGSSLPLIGYACFIASLFLLVRGYQFNTDDQAEHLPQVYQMLDPQLYPNDYFVNASNGIFTVRYYYEQLVLVVAKTIGLEWGLFILTFACIALMAYSFSRMAEELFQDRWAVLLAPIFVLFVFYNFTVGGNHIMYGSFISSTISKGIASFALLQFFRSRFVVMGFLLGLATLFQPLVGLQLFILAAAILVWNERKWADAVRFSLSYFSIALFILVPTFYRQFSQTMVYDKELYHHILFLFRNYHHYLPAVFPVNHYIKFFFLTAIGVILYTVFKPKHQVRVRGILQWGLFGMLVYLLAIYAVNMEGLAKIQWFKVTIWMTAMSALMLAGVLGQLLSGFTPLSIARTYLFPLSFSLFLLLLFAITNSKFLPASFQSKYMVGDRVYSDLEKMHFWIEANTRKDVSVLVSPDDNAFSCQAKRSMPIHFQAIIHEPFFLLPWYDDYKEIYGVSIENLEGIDSRQAAVELYQIRHYRGNKKRIDLRLDNLETCQFPNELGPIVHQEGPWVLTDF